MRGRRPEKPEAYSLEYVEDLFWPRKTQMCKSFASVEWHDSDRLRIMRIRFVECMVVERRWMHADSGEY